MASRFVTSSCDNVRKPVNIGRAKSGLPIAACVRVSRSFPRSVTSEEGNSV